MLYNGRLGGSINDKSANGEKNIDAGKTPLSPVVDNRKIWAQGKMRHEMKAQHHKRCYGS